MDHYLPYLYTSAVQRQYAFQAEKSTESALHQMVGRIERALQANKYNLGVFFDVEGAFDNTSCQSVKQALDEKKVHRAISAWIIRMLKHRIIMLKIEAFTLILTQCCLT